MKKGEPEYAPVEGKETLYDRIVRSVVYAAVFLVPLFYLPWTSSVVEYNKQLLLLVLVSVGVVSWLLGIVVNGKLSFRTSPLDKGVLGFLVATLITTIFSINRTVSLFGISFSLSDALMSVLAFTVFYFLASNIIRDRGRMLRTMLMSTLLLVLFFGFLQMLGLFILPGAFTHIRAFTTVGSLNVLGILAAISLPLFAKMSKGMFGKATGWVSGVGILLALAVLAILNWWVLWVVALAGMLAMVTFDSLNLPHLSGDSDVRTNRFAFSRFVIPMTVIVLGAFLFLVDFHLTSVRNELPVELAPTAGISWHTVTSTFSDRPIVGFGPEHFSVAFDRFGASGLAQTRFANSTIFDGNSEFMTMLAQGGIVALLAFFFLLWCFLQVSARFSKALTGPFSGAERTEFAMQSSGALAATIALTVAYFFYPFSFTLVFIWYVLLALSGLVVAGMHQRTIDIEERPAWSLAASLGFIIVLILVLTGVYFTVVRYVADARYAKAVVQEDHNRAFDGVRSAIQISGRNDRYYRDASQLALQKLNDVLAEKDGDEAQTQRVQEAIAFAVQLAQKATQIAPYESQNWANLGTVYRFMIGIVQDVEPLSEEAFTKASELRPGDPTFDNEIGQMWLVRSNLPGTPQQYRKEALEHAEDAFKRSLEKSPTFGLAIYNLGVVYDRQSRVGEAIKQLEQLIPANQDVPTLFFELGLLYARNGQTDAALIAMRRAVLLAPQYGDARWYLALLLEEQGDIQGALTNLRVIRENNPDNEMLLEKIAQLEATPPVTAEGEAIETEPLQ